MKKLTFILVVTLAFDCWSASPSFQQVTNIHNGNIFTLDQVATAGDPSTNTQNVVTWGAFYGNDEGCTNASGAAKVYVGDRLFAVSFDGTDNGWTVSGSGSNQLDGFYWQHFSSELLNTVQNGNDYPTGFQAGFLPDPATGWWTMVDGDGNVIATNNNSAINLGTWNQANGSGLNNGFTVTLGGGEVAATSVGDFRITGDVIATGTNKASFFELPAQTAAPVAIGNKCLLWYSNQVLYATTTNSTKAVVSWP